MLIKVISRLQVLNEKKCVFPVMIGILRNMYWTMGAVNRLNRLIEVTLLNSKSLRYTFVAFNN